MSNIDWETPEYLKPYFDEHTQIHYYNECKKHVTMMRQIDDKFLCLKSLSSSTPVINSAVFDTAAMGGGLYFRFNGIGIVIDPGIGFVSLMHKYGIFITDIDIVIVTHAHIDHNCDVSTLSALLYDYNRSIKKYNDFYFESLRCNKGQEHHIEWYLDNNTFNKTKDVLSNEEVSVFGDSIKAGVVTNISEKIDLQIIHTQHINNSDDTYGLKLSFETKTGVVTWGYTSDTAFFDELKEFFKDCDGLVLNISDIYKKDIEQKHFKKTHLGFSGCVELLNSIKPKTAIISEFCCTNGDYRHEIVRALRSRIKESVTTIFPGDIGLSVSIDTSRVECSLCKKDTSIECIKVIRPNSEFDKMEYVCSQCLL